MFGGRGGYAMDRKRAVLRVLALALCPAVLVAALALLFAGVHVGEGCTWCRYLSCVPFPPGDHPWWDCGRCSTEAGSVSARVFPNTTCVLRCPGGTTATFAGVPYGALSSNEVRDYYYTAVLCTTSNTLSKNTSTSS